MPYLILLTFLFAPAYTLRFRLLSYPTNILMIWGFLFWVIFFISLLVEKQLPSFLNFLKTFNKKVLVLVGLFFLSGLVSLFVRGLDRQKLGQFIVIFLQPISIFFIAGFIFRQNPRFKKFVFYTLYLILAAAGLYAILQYFTLIGLPPSYWGNSVEPKRALAFFIHPNFYALWAAPLLALLVPDVASKIKDKELTIRNYFYPVAWIIGGVGLLLSFSRAGWLGLAAAVAVYFFVGADKKVRKIIFAAAIMATLLVIYYPNLRYRVILPFYGEKSANSRTELWHDGWQGIKEFPILGLGLTGFAKQYSVINTDPTLDTHNFPHNIFLNFWVETGLLGLISFLGIAGLYIYQGFKNPAMPNPDPASRNNIIRLNIALFLIALITQGLVDNPYFKNDLAMIFWLILALSN